jgi:histidyl-tRNA synthetase
MPLFARKKLAGSRSVPSVVLVALPDEASRPACEQIAQTLRGRGIATEIAPTAQKYGKQIRFAERRGIPFVWFPSGSGGDSEGTTGHEVKDIRSGDQWPSDPALWAPPAEDLHPSVVQTLTEPAVDPAADPLLPPT